MVGVKALLQGFTVALDVLGVGVEGSDADLLAVGAKVEFRASQSIDAGHALQAQISEHVVERPVLHHDHDDVTDPLERLQVSGRAHDRPPKREGPEPRELVARPLAGREREERDRALALRFAGLPFGGAFPAACAAICLSIQSWFRSNTARVSAATTALRLRVSSLSCFCSPASDQFVEPRTV